LQDLDVDCGCAAIIAVVFVLCVSCDAVGAFGSCESEGCGFSDPGHDLARVEGEDGRVDVDVVLVEDLGEADWFEHWGGEVCGEWIFIWACVTPRFGMERLGLLQEPIQPTPIEFDIFQLDEGSFLVYLWVVGKLGPFYQAEYYRILEPRQHGSNSLERKRISGDRVV